MFIGFMIFPTLEETKKLFDDKLGYIIEIYFFVAYSVSSSFFFQLI